MIKSFFYYLKEIKNYYQLKNFLKKKINSKFNFYNNKNIVLFEITSMSSTHISYSYVVEEIRKLYKSELSGITTNLLSNYKYILFKLLSKLGLFHFGVYQSLGINKFFFLKQETFKKKIFFPKNKSQFLNFKYKGVIVGDLIYDSYLRYNYKSSLNLNDDDFKNFFIKSINYFDEVTKIFQKFNVKAVFLSHTVYLPAYIGRLALKKNSDFYCIGITHLIKLSKKDYYIHNHKKYKKIFNSLSSIDKKNGIAKARDEVVKRLEGVRSFNMEGLNKSPFHKKIDKKIIENSSKIKVLVATQCLIDSPHAFGNWIFNDFVEWLEYIGKISRITNYDWYIKPHPNNFRRNKEYVENYLKRYPKFRLVPQDTSHYSLKGKIDFVLTNWGNIGMDLALLKIKVINTNSNGRFGSFNFNLNPKNFSDYKECILNLNKYKSFKINKREILESYFVHNFYFGPDWIIKNYVKEMRKIGWNKKDTTIIYKYWIDKFQDFEFKNKKKKIINFIEKIKSEKKYYKLSPIKNLN